MIGFKKSLDKPKIILYCVPQTQMKRHRMTEIWKTIEEFPDYQVSNLGRVRRTVPSKNNHKAQKILKPGCSKTRNPRPMVLLYKNGKGHSRSVGRIVLSVFLGPPPKEKSDQCNHKDGNRKNNDLSNLEWVSCAENIKHALDTGLRKNQARGEKIGNSLLKEFDVIQIKEMLKQSNALTKIGKRFGVSKCTISDIKQNKTWKHVL